MFKLLQKIGKAFMLPIAILPAAGLLLGIGGALSNPTTVATYPVLNNPSLQAIFQVMSSAGEIVFANLSLLLCVGLCIGLAKRDKGTAALAGVTGYLVMKATIGALVKLYMAEGSAIDTGVIGAIAVGACAVWLHNRYHNIQLPQVLGFFVRVFRSRLSDNARRAPKSAGDDEHEYSQCEHEQGRPYIEAQAQDSVRIVDAQHLNPHPACGVDHEVDP